MTEVAQKASDRYLMVIQALRGVYHSAISGSNPFKELVRRRLLDEAHNIGRSFLETEAQQVNYELSQIALVAVRDARTAVGAGVGAQELDKRVSDHLSEIAQQLQLDITHQLQRDIDTVQRKFRSMMLQANLKATATGGKRQSHLVNLLAHDQGDLKFTFTDRLNRRWPSQKFIRTIWRAAMVQVYNETIMIVGSEFGVDRFKVTGEDPAHKFYGEILTLDSGANSYAGMKDEIFHPNTNLRLSIVSK